MRSGFTLTILLLFLSNVYGQHITDPGNTWNVVECIMGSCRTPVYSIGGDTTIGAYVYKKVEYNQDSGNYVFRHIEAIREDSLAHKVYFYDTYEYLAYDFSLNPGDHFSADCFGSPMDETVSVVDSVTLLSGERRKRITLNWMNEEWIEGIGSNYGLPNTAMYFCTADITARLICFSDTNQELYHETAYPTCYINTTAVDELGKENSVTVYPNPSNGELTVSLNGISSKDYYVRIYTSEGKILQMFQSSNTEFNIPNKLNPGIYTLRIQDAEGNLFRRVVVVQ